MFCAAQSCRGSKGDHRKAVQELERGGANAKVNARPPSRLLHSKFQGLSHSESPRRTTSVFVISTAYSCAYVFQCESIPATHICLHVIDDCQDANKLLHCDFNFGTRRIEQLAHNYLYHQCAHSPLASLICQRLNKLHQSNCRLLPQEIHRQDEARQVSPPALSRASVSQAERNLFKAILARS